MPNERPRKIWVIPQTSHGRLVQEIKKREASQLKIENSIDTIEITLKKIRVVHDRFVQRKNVLQARLEARPITANDSTSTAAQKELDHINAELYAADRFFQEESSRNMDFLEAWQEHEDSADAALRKITDTLH